jgi:hypothetical protein
VDRSLGQRQERSGRDDPTVADDHRAIVERRAGREDRAEQVGRDVAVDHHAGLGDLLETGLALEDDEGALADGGQLGRRARDLGRHMGDRTRLRGRQEPSERTDPTDALEGASQLRLEDDHEGEQADDCAGLEDLGEQPQVECDRKGIDEDEDADADHQADRARPADEAEQPVDEERGDSDVDDRRQVNLVEDRREWGHRPRV